MSYWKVCSLSIHLYSVVQVVFSSRRRRVMSDTIFQKRIRELMKEKRYSQRKLCDLCGITEAAFSRYMTSQRIPKAEILANLANILGTTSDYLIGNEAKYGYDQLRFILASSMDDLSPNQRKELTSILMDEYKRTEV